MTFISAAALLVGFALSVLWCGRELAKERPSERRMACAVSLMIALAVLAGGALTAGVA